jgi:hypothetical protein
LLNKPKNFTTAMDEGQEYRNVLELVKGSTAKIGAVGEWTKHNWFVVVHERYRHDSCLLYQVKII